MDNVKNNQDVEIKTVELEIEPPSRLGFLLIFCLIVAVVVFLTWGIWQAANPPVPPIQGQIDARTLSISSKVSGRVLRVLVKEGASVKAGQPIVELTLPELEAKLGQAKAREAAVKAQKELVDEGARPQEIEAARAEWKRAQTAAELSEKTFKRIEALHKDGLVSTQKFDEVSAQNDAAQQLATAAKQKYDIATIGARKQERKQAEDMTRQAEEGVREVESLAKDRVLVAPSDGQVDKVVLVEGELAPAGFPIVTLIDLKDEWAAFNFREDQMPGIKIGSELKGQIPALDNKIVPFEVYYISPKANYATWRSTRQDTGYDMKTFEVRARPKESIEGLRPGMSVLIPNED